MPTFDPEPVALYARLYPVLVSLARRLGLEGEAEDLAQETLVQILIRYPAFVGLEFPVGYAKTVLYRLAARQRRRRVEQVDLSRAIAGSLESSSPDISTEIVARLSTAFELGRLPPRQRACLYLMFVEGLSDRDIAQVLGCRASTVRSQVGRGLRVLARTFEGGQVMSNLGLGQ
jgi:RNA polymerase sigma factor (sigma-70 family)